MVSNTRTKASNTFVQTTKQYENTLFPKPGIEWCRKRYNRTIVGTARINWIESKLPPSYWFRAVDTAIYVRNLVRNEKSEKNYYGKFWGRKPKSVT